MNLCQSQLLLLLVLLAILPNSAAKEDSLYNILGVSKTANTKEIKKAYRRKALDTHPDKNTNIPADEAAEAFRKVVHAFETLSDERSRKYYDRTGRSSDSSSSTNAGSGGGQRRNSYSQSWTFTWNYGRRTFRLKDRFDVQQAQSRVLHVVSLEQLRTIMLDDDDLLERNLLMCFVKPGKVEKMAEDDMVFPYPFAGMSSQRIWWEDLLQTVQIRFHKSNDLSRFFDIPSEMDAPVFLFAQRGKPLAKESFVRLQTSDRQEFETWVWKQIQIEVEFVNQHSHPVEIYWIHGNTAHLKVTLEPAHSNTITSMLSHQFWARDARVDTRDDAPNRYKLTDDSSMGSWKILNDTNPQQIIIENKTCFDFSGHCPFWKGQGECRKNPNFMHDVCRKTCKICTQDQTSVKDEL